MEFRESVSSDSRLAHIRSNPAWARALVSGLVIFFLIFEFLVPNPDFLISEQFAPLLNPIANLFNLNVMWQFFSPDPGGIMYLSAKIKKGDQIIATEEMPPRDHIFALEDRYLRRSAIMRYMLNDFTRLKTILIPWYCRFHPEATEVQVDLDTFSFASIEEIQSGARTFNDHRDNVKRVLSSASCASVTGTQP